MKGKWKKGGGNSKREFSLVDAVKGEIILRKKRETLRGEHYLSTWLPRWTGPLEGEGGEVREKKGCSPFTGGILY